MKYKCKTFIHVYFDRRRNNPHGQTCRKKTGDVTDGEVRCQVRGKFQGTIYYMNIETGERSGDLRTTHFHFEIQRSMMLSIRSILSISQWEGWLQCARLKQNSSLTRFRSLRSLWSITQDFIKREQDVKLNINWILQENENFKFIKNQRNENKKV